MELGAEIAYGFSRDRTQMAFLSNRSEGCEKYCLRVMDLQQWAEVGQPVPVQRGLSTWFLLPSNFAADGAVIPVILKKQTDTASEAILVDRSRGAVTARVQLPASVTRVAVTPQGHLAVYGLQTRRGGSGADAYLALLSGADLSTLWEPATPEITFFEGELDPTDPNAGRYYDPAVVFTPDGGRLYIAAADQPLLLTVDFAQRRISTVRIQPRAGWLERLFGARAAQAKSMNGISQSGALSPDGRYLLVVGQETRVQTNERGEYVDERIPLGLQVIDTQDGTLVREVDTGASLVALAPDGRSILLSGWTLDDNGGREWAELLDPSTGKVVQRLSGFARPSRLLDGSTAWLVVPPGPGASTALELYRPGDQEPRSRVTHTRSIDWIVIP